MKVFEPEQQRVSMTRERLLELLDELRSMIVVDGSMEGVLAYEWGENPGTYNVACAFRTGSVAGPDGEDAFVGVVTAVVTGPEGP